MTFLLDAFDSEEEAELISSARKYTDQHERKANRGPYEKSVSASISVTNPAV